MWNYTSLMLQCCTAGCVTSQDTFWYYSSINFLCCFLILHQGYVDSDLIDSWLSESNAYFGSWIDPWSSMLDHRDITKVSYRIYNIWQFIVLLSYVCRGAIHSSLSSAEDDCSSLLGRNSAELHSGEFLSLKYAYPVHMIWHYILIYLQIVLHIFFVKILYPLTYKLGFVI